MAAVERLEYAELGFTEASKERDRLSELVEHIIGGMQTWEKVVIRTYYIDAKTDSEVAALMGYPDRRRAGEARAAILQTLEAACVGAHIPL